MYNPYPKIIDLLPGVDSLPNQGASNKCQTFSFALALETLHKRAGSIIQVNRDAMYWLAKNSGNGGNNGDIGARMMDVGAAASTYGVSTHPAWRDNGDLDTDPPQDVIDQAGLYRGVAISGVPYIRSGPAVDDAVMTLIMLLARGDIPIGTFNLTDSFYNSAGGYSNFRDTNWNAADGSWRGEHVVPFFGVDFDRGVFMAANHWGEYWGDGGFFGVPFDKIVAGPQRCFTSLCYISACAVQPVPVHNIMTNPVPTALTAPQFADYEAAVVAELRRVFVLNSWPGVLGTGALLKLSDKQVEMYAPALDGGPGHGLPRGIIRSLVDSGGIQAVTGLRMETSA